MSKEREELITKLINEEELILNHKDNWFLIYTNSDNGFDFDIYKSKKDLENEDIEQFDGGYFTGDAMDVIAYLTEEEF